MSDAHSSEYYRSRVRARATKLTARSLSKYGDTALHVGGDPTRDVFDYCINELAGLPRYADMMAYRVSELVADDTNLHRRANYIIRRVREEGEHLAFILERLRLELLADRHKLGQPEDLNAKPS